jgi:hypothetical protein
MKDSTSLTPIYDNDNRKRSNYIDLSTTASNVLPNDTNPSSQTALNNDKVQYIYTFIIHFTLLYLYKYE